MIQKRLVEIKKSTPLLDDFIKVDEALVTYQRLNGAMSDEIRRLNIRREDACCVLLYDKTLDSLLLVNQFRFPSHTRGEDFLNEIPAGLKDPKETHQESIIRETLEETGYEIIDPVFLFWFFPSAGISSEKCYLFYSEVNESMKKHLGGGLESENEEIETLWLPRRDLSNWIQNGKVHDAKTIIALQWFLLSGL